MVLRKSSCQRADTKKFLPGVYEIPGGHIDLGENIIEGLKREICEEFEVEVAVGDPFAAFDYTNHIKGSHSIEVVYFATLIGSPDDIKLHAEDHSSFEWIAKDDLPKLVSTKKTADNPEYKAIQKAFALLEGDSLDFAS